MFVKLVLSDGSGSIGVRTEAIDNLASAETVPGVVLVMFGDGRLIRVKGDLDGMIDTLNGVGTK